MDTKFPLFGGGLVLVAAPMLAIQSQSTPGRATFAKPVPLMDGKSVLGAELRYPSPALHDLDGDGKLELVVGDLTGRVHIASAAGGASETQWTELTPLQSDSEDLKFNNW